MKIINISYVCIDSRILHYFNKQANTMLSSFKQSQISDGSSSSLVSTLHLQFVRFGACWSTLGESCGWFCVNEIVLNAIKSS